MKIIGRDCQSTILHLLPLCQFLDACEECKNGERLGEEVAGIDTPPAWHKSEYFLCLIFLEEIDLVRYRIIYEWTSG